MQTLPIPPRKGTTLFVAVVGLLISGCGGGTVSTPGASVSTPLGGSSTCTDWSKASASTRQQYATKVRPEINVPVQFSNRTADVAYVYGLIGGRCHRAEQAGRAAHTTLSEVLQLAAQSSVAASPAADFTPQFTWTWHESVSGGYRYSTTLRVGKFAHFSVAPLLPGFVAKTQITANCGGFDETTDAVAPAELSMTNNTSGFPATLETALYMVNPSTYPYGEGQATNVMAALGYSHGSQCYGLTDWNGNTGGQGWDVKWTEKIPPGGSTGGDYAYLILPGYYSPNAPNGESAMLRNANLEIGPAPQHSITSLHGSGVFRGPNGVAPVIPLSGKQACEDKESENGVESVTLVCG